MNGALGPRDIAGHAEKGNPQVFDFDVREGLLEGPGISLAGSEGKQGECKVLNQAGVAEQRTVGLQHFIGRHSKSMLRGDDGAHAGAPDDIDGSAVLVKRSQSADVGEAARSATTQGEADGLTGQEAGEP